MGSFYHFEVCDQTHRADENFRNSSMPNELTVADRHVKSEHEVIAEGGQELAAVSGLIWLYLAMRRTLPQP